MEREDLSFPSGDGRCAAWLYRPDGVERDAPCVVMSHGFSLTRHDGLAAYAERFAAAGAAALVFDPRHLGDSPGTPRQRFRHALQREDWRSAVAFARGLEGVDAERLVLWGFSYSCALVIEQAVEDPRGIAAILALAPMIDGLARALATPPSLVARIIPRATADALGRHTTVPVTARPGGLGAMALPGEADGFARVVPAGSPWRNRISPATYLTVVAIRPVRHAARLRMPVWVGSGDRDISVSPKAAERLAQRAPRGELTRYPFDHFDPFDPAVGGPDRVAGDQVAFLARHGLADASSVASAAVRATRQ